MATRIGPKEPGESLRRMAQEQTNRAPTSGTLDELTSRENIEAMNRSRITTTAADCENRVGLLLENELPDTWEVTHDVIIHTQRGEQANVDHLISTPLGVMMIDTKWWSGELDLKNGSFTSDRKATEIVQKSCPTALWEAKMLEDGKAPNTPVCGVVFAVCDGTVNYDHGQLRLQADHPEMGIDPAKRTLPWIPTVAVEEGDLIQYITRTMIGHHPTSGVLAPLVEGNPRLSW